MLDEVLLNSISFPAYGLLAQRSMIVRFTRESKMSDFFIWCLFELCHMQWGCSTINKKTHFSWSVPVCLESVPLFPVLMSQELDYEFGLMMVISSVITSSWSVGLYMVCVCLCEHVIEAEMERKSQWWRPRPEGLPRQLDWWEQMATQLSVSVCVRKQQRNSAHKSERGTVCTCSTSYIQ